jgi:ribosome biogenesis GTPase
MAAADPDGIRRGRVVALQANFCRVALDRPEAGAPSELLCTRRTRLARDGVRIHVGDRVGVEGIDWVDGRGAIGALEPRRNLLQRPAVANVSRILVVAALRQPRLDPLQLTRFLITAERTGCPVELVLTKSDLLPPDEVEAWCATTSAWGYPVHAVSPPTGNGIETLRRQLLGQPGITVLCGPSGVGKSSLLNALLPELRLRVAAVSGRLQRGRHTTRHVELFALGNGALVADSPGFNRPALPSDPLELAQAFPELRTRLEKRPCRFRDCRHRGDPGCAVDPDWPRYPLYRSCLEELLEEEAAAPAARTSGRGRPPSRRRLRQATGPDLAGDLSSPDPAG